MILDSVKKPYQLLRAFSGLSSFPNLDLDVPDHQVISILEILAVIMQSA